MTVPWSGRVGREAPLLAARAVDTSDTGFRPDPVRRAERAAPDRRSALAKASSGRTANLPAPRLTAPLTASAKASGVGSTLTSASSVIARRPLTFRRTLRLQGLLQQLLLPEGVVPAAANRRPSSPPASRSRPRVPDRSGRAIGEWQKSVRHMPPDCNAPCCRARVAGAVFNQGRPPLTRERVPDHVRRLRECSVITGRQIRPKRARVVVSDVVQLTPASVVRLRSSWRELRRIVC